MIRHDSELLCKQPGRSRAVFFAACVIFVCASRRRMEPSHSFCSRREILFSSYRPENSLVRTRFPRASRRRTAAFSSFRTRTSHNCRVQAQYRKVPFGRFSVHSSFVPLDLFRNTILIQLNINTIMLSGKFFSPAPGLIAKVLLPGSALLSRKCCRTRRIRALSRAFPSYCPARCCNRRSSLFS